MCLNQLITKLFGGHLIKNIFKLNDGAGNFNDGAGNLMMAVHSNLTIEQLHHKTPANINCIEDLTLSTLSNLIGLFHSLFWIELKRSIVVKGLIQRALKQGITLFVEHQM